VEKILSKVVPWLPSARRNPGAGESLSAEIRVLDDADTAALRALISVDPVVNIFMDAQLAVTGSARPGLGGSLILGRFHGAQLVSACWIGANVVPINITSEDAEDFGHVVKALNRTFASCFGPAEAVMGIWKVLVHGSQRAFSVRPNQPFMTLSGPPAVEPNPGLRLSTPGEYEKVLPACAKMFTEELGYSPLVNGGSYYRSRVRSLIHAGHSFIDMDGAGEIRFKAELGTVSSRATQIQGVWMAPEHRGGGLAAGYMAAAANYALALAPTTSLYVNDYNSAAIATYRKVGFEEVGEFATILF
jgi:ribosomal protein S18 acetylase RimI-like enzyme